MRHGYCQCLWFPFLFTPLTRYPSLVFRYFSRAPYHLGAHGGGHGPLLPTREVLSGRRAAGRPAAGVHANRLRNELRDPGRHFEPLRRHDLRSVQGFHWRGFASAFSSHGVRGRHEGLRYVDARSHVETASVSIIMLFLIHQYVMCAP